MSDEFALEPSPPAGTVPAATMNELRAAYRTARDYSQSFADAVRAQAEARKINPKALRRYIAALEGDKVKDAAEEAADLERLIEQGN